jgi:hypothetical protein
MDFTLNYVFWSVLGPTKKGPKTRVSLGVLKNSLLGLFDNFFYDFIKTLTKVL